MKVYCINDTGFWFIEKKFVFGLIKKVVKSKGPEYGDVVTVVSQEYDEGELCYNLLEWPGNEPYEAKEFIPLSNIDEMEMIRESTSVKDFEGL